MPGAKGEEMSDHPLKCVCDHCCLLRAMKTMSDVMDERDVLKQELKNQAFCYEKEKTALKAELLVTKRHHEKCSNAGTLAVIDWKAKAEKLAEALERWCKDTEHRIRRGDTGDIIYPVFLLPCKAEEALAEFEK